MSAGAHAEPARLVVLIPAYNTVKTIGRAIVSAKGQAGVDRVLVIDDGSRDETAKIAQEHGARVIVQPNTGPAAARNRGLDELARLIASDGGARHALFLDADDELRAGATSKILQAIEHSPHAACVVGGHLQKGEKKSKERRPDPAWTPALAHRGIILGTSHIFCTSGLTLTGRTIEQGIRFDPTLHFGEDRDLIYRAAALGPVALIDDLLFTKFDEPGRMTASPDRLVRWLSDVVVLCDKHDPVDADKPRADAITQEHLRMALSWIDKHAQRQLASQGKKNPDDLDARVNAACARRGWTREHPSRSMFKRLRQMCRSVLPYSGKRRSVE